MTEKLPGAMYGDVSYMLYILAAAQDSTDSTVQIRRVCLLHIPPAPAPAPAAAADDAVD